MSGVDALSTPRSSSSSVLSSPSHSLSDPGSPAARQLTIEHRHAQSAAFPGNPFGVEAPLPPPRKKPGRKPGSTNKPKVHPDGTPMTILDAAKVKRTRKPRDPNLPPIQRRKKGLIQDALANPRLASKQPKMIDVNLRPSDANYHVPPPMPSDAIIAQTGKSEDIPRPMSSFFNHPGPPPPPPPQQQQHQPLLQAAPGRTSGQNYDPIRSNYDPVRETTIPHNPFSNSQLSPQYAPLPNRASASPSISSLVDPPYPAATSPSVATQSFFQHQMKMHSHEGHNSVPPSPTTSRPAPSPMMNPIVPSPAAPGMVVERQPEAWPKAPVPAHFNMVNSVPGPSTIAKKTASNAAHSAASSSAPSPKPPKLVDITPPPLPGASSLIPNGMFGNGPNDGTESRAPTIVLHIPMNGETNRYVNFGRLAEERYGWEALHPRLAAQRERLARVAAAGAALEKNGTHKESGDEMSLDMSEGEGDVSNVEMGGISDGRTGTDGGKKPTKKRKMKEDEYDKDDGFVDDTELLWEEQAAASKDGFFVYSGPLVPEFEKPVLERTDGAPKRGRGGRGRGAGRGTTSTRGGGTGGGPGSRGGSITRKPRITKADRARMDQEKADRAKMGALAAKPTGYGEMSHLASAASMGGTPMMFNQ